MKSGPDDIIRHEHRPPCPSVLLFVLILSSLIFQSIVGMSHLPTAGHSLSAFSAHSNPSCLEESVSRDAWACDVARAEYMLRNGRSCRSPPPDPQSQCLVLSNRSADDLCLDSSPDRRRQRSRQLTLTFCHKYSLNLLLRDEDWTGLLDSTNCHSKLQPLIRDLMQRDMTASSLFCEFHTLLSRFNCHTGYSVKWNCSHCTSTYKDWVCSTVLQFYRKGRLVRPCRSMCERVEQRCPYFHPWHRDQYAGEPAFVCIDPMIPFIPALTPVTPFGDPDSCYDACDLVHNCTTDLSDRDCVRQRSSTTDSSANPETMRTTTTMRRKEKQSATHDLPLDQRADDEVESDDEAVADISSDLQPDDDVDDELENSSSLTTESVRRSEGRERS